MPAALSALLRSRKFWLTLYALIQTVVAHFYQVPNDVIVQLDALVMILVGAIAYEDAHSS